MSPAGSHNTKAPNGCFEDSDLAHVIRRVVGLRAFLNESELDDRYDNNTIEGETVSFDFGTMGEIEELGHSQEPGQENTREEQAPPQRRLDASN